MHLVKSPTELTTSATDAVLAIECVVIIVCLLPNVAAERWRTKLWRWVFGLLAISSGLGALLHGLDLRDSIRAVLWKPLYLSLGVLMALFLVGAVADWRGPALARRLVPWSVALGAVFFGLTELLRGSFIIFVVYEASVMVGALVIYIILAATHRLKGAAVVALAIVLNLAAAGVQATQFSVHFLFPFDHNGVFHLVQMLGTAILGLGLCLAMSRSGSVRSEAMAGEKGCPRIN